MHKIVALWAVPRSTSTAFEWMMRQRGDLDCLHEPFGEAWYQGEAPLWHRFTPGDVTTPGLTLESVWADIQARAEKGPVFLKDFPHYINHMWDDAFLANFTHAFLIRDPAKTITSMHHKWPDFHEGEVGFPEQRALFDLLCALNGAPPPVIDSDDLLENPHDMTRAFCNAVGIPFIPAGPDTGSLAETRPSIAGGTAGRSTPIWRNLPASRRKNANMSIFLEDTPPRVQQVHTGG